MTNSIIHEIEKKKRNIYIYIYITKKKKLKTFVICREKEILKAKIEGVCIIFFRLKAKLTL